MTDALPVLTVPWHFVQHDNHRLMPGRHRRLITSPLYRQAKESAEISIKQQWRGCPRLAGAIRLTARCFFPDNRRRDAGNYRKMVTDAMSGICYDDDAQLESETWQKAGIDRTEPRIEITLSAIGRCVPGYVRGAGTADYRNTSRSGGMIGGPLKICRVCDIPHYDNCPECFGFGVRVGTDGEGYAPVSAQAGHVCHRHPCPVCRDEWLPCPSCRSTPAGLPTEARDDGEGWEG